MLYLLTYLSANTNTERGAGFAEYALLLALVAVIGIVTLGPMGAAIAAMFTQITTAL